MLNVVYLGVIFYIVLIIYVNTFDDSTKNHIYSQVTMKYNISIKYF